MDLGEEAYAKSALIHCEATFPNFAASLPPRKTCLWLAGVTSAEEAPTDERS